MPESDGIKNLPPRIWLQVVGDGDAEGDFCELHREVGWEMTWAPSRIYDADVEYVRAEEFREAVRLLTEFRAASLASFSADPRGTSIKRAKARDAVDAFLSRYQGERTDG